MSAVVVTAEVADCGCAWSSVEEYEAGVQTDRYLSDVRLCPTHRSAP